MLGIEFEILFETEMIIRPLFNDKCRFHAGRELLKALLETPALWQRLVVVIELWAAFDESFEESPALMMSQARIC